MYVHFSWLLYDLTDSSVLMSIEEQIGLTCTLFYVIMYPFDVPEFEFSVIFLA